MSKHNYSQYANKNRENKKEYKKTEPLEIKMEHKESEEVVLMGPIETVETACPTKTVAGVVANCAKLNVRSKPSITGEIVCVLNASSEIEIDVEKSVTDWVYICTATGVEGYCMRQFIKSDM